MIVHARDGELQIGREGGDMNFPNDPYISGTHLKLAMAGDALKLTDLGSKNGTYLKISGEKSLAHGDYLFIGKQLLRVEITN
jgi:pSer/pThr/pTyr-binding forkhead associated (FHA) protein